MTNLFGIVGIGDATQIQSLILHAKLYTFNLYFQFDFEQNWGSKRTFWYKLDSRHRKRDPMPGFALATANFLARGLVDNTPAHLPSKLWLKSQTQDNGVGGSPLGAGSPRTTGGDASTSRALQRPRAGEEVAAHDQYARKRKYQAVAEEVSDKHGFEDDERKELLRASQLDPQELLITVYGHIVALGLQKVDNVSEAYLSGEFKARPRMGSGFATHKLQSLLLEPTLSTYVGSLTSRVIRFMQNNQRAFELPDEVMVSCIYSREFFRAVGKVLTTFRSTMLPLSYGSSAGRKPDLDCSKNEVISNRDFRTLAEFPHRVQKLNLGAEFLSGFRKLDRTETAEHLTTSLVVRNFRTTGEHSGVKSRKETCILGWHFWCITCSTVVTGLDRAPQRAYLVAWHEEGQPGRFWTYVDSKLAKLEFQYTPEDKDQKLKDILESDQTTYPAKKKVEGKGTVAPKSVRQRVKPIWQRGNDRFAEVIGSYRVEDLAGYAGEEEEDEEEGNRVEIETGNVGNVGASDTGEGAPRGWEE
ncbi:hypothetical protein BDV93DRAFT_516475 [Ceratobasidium sp. AG-I]|nr:hypothetical protein BDV93DRAFT_516475 [Ceratobasidium sp. AG-I]